MYHLIILSSKTFIADHNELFNLGWNNDTLRPGIVTEKSELQFKIFLNKTWQIDWSNIAVQRTIETSNVNRLFKKNRFRSLKKCNDKRICTTSCWM